MEISGVHSLAIEFCVPCEFRPQAVEFAREALGGWAPALRQVVLLQRCGGRFEVCLDHELIFFEGDARPARTAG
jgi:predicted Rdx family selenoprotein